MKKTLYLLALALMVFTAKAQYVGCKPSDLVEYKSRTLVVALLEETKGDLKIVQSKLKKFPDAMDNYKAQIELYNTTIQERLPEMWTFNKKIEFRPYSEVEKLRQSNSKDYILLFYSVSTLNGPESITYFGVPTFSIVRPYGTLKMCEYSSFLPHINDVPTLNETSIKLGLELLQDGMNYMIKQNKKSTVLDMIDADIEKNCGSFSSKKVVVQKSTVYEKQTEAEIQAEIKNKLVFVSDEDYLKSIENSEDDLVLVFLPFTVVSGIPSSYLGGCKVAMSSDKKYYQSTGTKITKPTIPFLMVLDAKRLAECPTPKK